MWMQISAVLLAGLALVDLTLVARASLRRRGAHVGVVLALAPLTAVSLGAWFLLDPPPSTSGGTPPVSAFLLPMSLPVAAFFLGFAYLLSCFLGAASETRRLFAWHTALALAIGVAGILGLVALERGLG